MFIFSLKLFIGCALCVVWVLVCCCIALGMCDGIVDVEVSYGDLFDCLIVDIGCSSCALVVVLLKKVING